MLHGIHKIFPPPSVSGHTGGDPISEKKLKNLEGLWDNVKEVLGWILNGANFTITLPPAKVKSIQARLKQILRWKKIRLNDMQKIAGTLLHAAFGIPGGRGLFNPLWASMKAQTPWITLTPDLKAVFRDFQWLFRDIVNNPINIAQLVPSTPKIAGYSDACKRGAGGVWILPGKNGPRFIVWYVEFPPEILQLLEAGILSINDLEMAGVLLEWLVLEVHLPSLQFVQAGISYDNSSSVHWSRKFLAKSLIAGHLLRALALRQQICKSAPLLVISIEGILNRMADVASRFESDKTLQQKAPNLTAYFNKFFPQQTSWIRYQLPPKLISLVTSSLQGKRSSLESWRRLPGLAKNIGPHGYVMQTPSKWTHFCPTQTPWSETWHLQHTLRGSGGVYTDAEIKSAFQESLRRYRPSARPSSWLDIPAQSTGTSNDTTLL